MASVPEFIADIARDVSAPAPNEAFLDRMIYSWELDRVIGDVTYPGKRVLKEADGAPSPTYLFLLSTFGNFEPLDPRSLFETEARAEPGWRDFVNAFIDRELWSRTLERRARCRTRAKKGTASGLPSPLRDEAVLARSQSGSFAHPRGQALSIKESLGIIKGSRSFLNASLFASGN